MDFEDQIMFGRRNRPNRETSAIGWSACGQLTNDNQELGVPLQANFQHPGVYTVQFYVSNKHDTDGSGIDDIITPEAEIVWNVEGNSVRRRFSIVDGLQVSGAGSGVNVEVYDITQISAVAHTQAYNVTILCTPGCRPATTQPPTLQEYIDYFGINFGTVTIAPAGSLFIPIPQNAGVQSIFVTGGVSGGGVITPGTLEFSQVSAGLAQLKVCNSESLDVWIPISNQASAISVKNTDAAKTYVASFTFGIDG